MQISKGFEQGIYVLLILEIKDQGHPLKSQFLSEQLQVSDSSLKKILRKLVTAKLIQSVASKDGGFMLGRPIQQISLADVLKAVEGPHPIKFRNTHLANQIFDEKSHAAHLQKSEILVDNTLNKAENAYLQQLATLTLDQLLEKNQ